MAAVVVVAVLVGVCTTLPVVSVGLMVVLVVLVVLGVVVVIGTVLGAVSVVVALWVDMVVVVSLVVVRGVVLAVLELVVVVVGSGLGDAAVGSWTDHEPGTEVAPTGSSSGEGPGPRLWKLGTVSAAWLLR